jgi:hypothetical protein
MSPLPPFFLLCKVREKCQIDVNVIRMLIMDSIHCMQELGMHKQNCGREQRWNSVSPYQCLILQFNVFGKCSVQDTEVVQTWNLCKPWLQIFFCEDHWVNTIYLFNPFSPMFSNTDIPFKSTCFLVVLKISKSVFQISRTYLNYYNLSDYFLDFISLNSHKYENAREHITGMYSLLQWVKNRTGSRCIWDLLWKS